jgi:hypothetical protein
MYALLRTTLVAAITTAMITSCATDQKIDSALAALIASIQRKCQFVPSIFSIASLVGVPGAPQGEKLVNAVCDAANKAKVETAEAQAKSGNPSFLGRGASVPPGVPLEFKVNGKSVSGVTSN